MEIYSRVLESAQSLSDLPSEKITESLVKSALENVNSFIEEQLADIEFDQWMELVMDYSMRFDIASPHASSATELLGKFLAKRIAGERGLLVAEKTIPYPIEWVFSPELPKVYAGKAVFYALKELLEDYQYHQPEEEFIIFELISQHLETRRAEAVLSADAAAGVLFLMDLVLREGWVTAKGSPMKAISQLIVWAMTDSNVQEALLSRMHQQRHRRRLSSRDSLFRIP
ncbi:hypothetical protein DFJ73DRAFT_967053, partial [Zopfochytrium polystomum]